MAGHEVKTPEVQREPPAPAPVRAAAPPPPPEPLFGTGLGLGMEPPTPTSFLDRLSRRPAEERSEVIGSLNKASGNRKVSRMIERHAGHAALARKAPVQLESQPDLVRKAVKSRDVGDIKAITNFSSATVPERVDFIGILLNQGWVGPMDEYALERIWNSFGDGIAGVAKGNPGLWKNCVERGMDPSNVVAVDGMRKAWESDVKAIATGYMQENLRFANTELERLGLREPTGAARRQRSGRRTWRVCTSVSFAATAGSARGHGAWQPTTS